MPNHVCQKLTVLGPADEVSDYLEKSREARPRTGDKPKYDAQGIQINPNYREQESEAPAFGFHGVVPLPEYYSQVPYSNHDGIGGYEIERNTWGVKWGPYNIDESDIRLAPGRADLVFTTAWNLPYTYYKRASERYPNLTFVVSYNGEGLVFGCAVFHGGTVVHGGTGDVDALPTVEWGAPDEDEQYEKMTAALDYYMRGHEQLVKLVQSNQLIDMPEMEDV